MARELTLFSDRDDRAAQVQSKFAEFLKKKGLRMTPQRQAILDLLLVSEHHVSQEEIYAKLKARGIGKVTVFRTLKMLETSGLVDSVASPGGKRRYELETGRPHHDHLICVECGRIIEIRWAEVEKIQERACKKIGFRPLYHRHEIFGRCKACDAKVRER